MTDDESRLFEARLRRRRTAAYAVLAVSAVVTLAGVWLMTGTEDEDDLTWLAGFATVLAGMMLGIVVSGLMGAVGWMIAGGAVATGVAGAGAAAVMFLVADQPLPGAATGLGAVVSGVLGVWAWTPRGRHALASALGIPEGKPVPGPAPRRADDGSGAGS